MLSKRELQFLHKLVDVEEDISQVSIIDKLVRYLGLMKRDKHFANKMENAGGYCYAFTVLVLYALQLTLTQKLRYPLRGRDDWQWLKTVLLRLAKWDGGASEIRQLQRDTDRLISYLTYFQNYRPLENRQIHDLQYHLQDTNGFPLRQEYTLAGVFCYDDFIKPITLSQAAGQQGVSTLLQEILKENRLMLFGTLDHALGLFKYKNYYLYYDPNHERGIKIFSARELTLLVVDIFEASGCDLSESLGLNFNVFSAVNIPAVTYVPQAALLHALGHPHQLIGDDRNRATALHLSSQVGCAASLKYYLKHAPIALKEYMSLLENTSESPMGIAVQYDSYEVLSTLLFSGADPDSRAGKINTLLYRAILNGNVNMVLLLLAYGADPDLPADHDKDSPLSIALYFGEFECARQLLLKGANPDFIKPCGHSLLFDAVNSCDLESVDLLLKHGADINIRNQSGQTAFYRAAYLEDREIIAYLLEDSNLYIGPQEYEIFMSGLENNEEWLEYKNKVDLQHLITLIRCELEEPTISSANYRKVNQQLQIIMGLHGCNSAKKIELLIDNLLPGLRQIAQTTGRSLWQAVDVFEPVFAFANTISLRDEKYKL